MDQPPGPAADRRVALLIDADNLSHAKIAAMLAEPVTRDRELALRGVEALAGGDPAAQLAVHREGFVVHVRENRMAADVKLKAEDLAVLDGAFPRSSHLAPLEML